MTTSSEPFVHSNYERIDDDNYVTIDPRCMKTLMSSYEIPGVILDPCTRSGETGLAPAEAGELADLHHPYIKSAVTNPPYSRPAVDMITQSLIGAVSWGTIDVAAILVRVGWDCAKSREAYWQWPFAASIRLLYRPWWSQERIKQPIHSYQWLIWDRRHQDDPVVIHAGAGE